MIPEQNRNLPDEEFEELYRVGSAWHEELRAYFPEQPTSELMGRFASQGLCVNRSQEWDCDRPGAREDPATTARRVFPSVMACRSCPMFTDCAVLVSLDRTPHGVYAGEFYDSSSPKKQADVRAELKRVRQIRGVK